MPLIESEQYPDQTILRRRMRAYLGSAAMRTITVDRVLRNKEERAIPQLNYGDINIRIDSEAPFGNINLLRNTQYTELELGFKQGRGMSIKTRANLPFDTEMELDTTEEWKKWGTYLHYANYKTSGYFATSFSPKMSLVIKDTLATLLQDVSSIDQAVSDSCCTDDK
jgi:hypothetical protein